MVGHPCLFGLPPRPAAFCRACPQARTDAINLSKKINTSNDDVIKYHSLPGSSTFLLSSKGHALSKRKNPELQTLKFGCFFQNKQCSQTMLKRPECFVAIFRRFSLCKQFNCLSVQFQPPTVKKPDREPIIFLRKKIRLEKQTTSFRPSIEQTPRKLVIFFLLLGNVDTPPPCGDGRKPPSPGEFSRLLKIAASRNTIRPLQSCRNIT